MADYEPTSRRPIADVFRRASGFAVEYCVRAKVHPDTISYASVAAAGLCGAGLWFSGANPWLLLVAPLFAYLRLWFNMLDGMVALAAKRASLRGEIVNELPDRVSDVLIFVGLAHSGLAHPASGYWAAIFALLTAYVGTLGQAVAGRREFGGVMAKPYRMVVVHLSAWVTFGLIAGDAGRASLGPLTALDWACVVVVAGCVQTIVVRLRRTVALLRERAAG